MKNGYIAIYKGKQIEVYANTSLEARNEANKIFRAKNEYDIIVMLAEKDNKPVIHTSLF